MKKTRILVTPLNWGLGHATRCMPIIRELQRQGAEVLIGSDGPALTLLRQEFPEIECLELPPYNIHYKSANMVWNMGVQALKIIKAIWLEQQEICSLVHKHRIDGIITDNRFGSFCKPVPAIFLTHQINIITPFPTQNFVRFLNYRMIRKYEECWVPDFEQQPNLTGALSHGHDLKNVRYVGYLSRMHPKKIDQQYDIIVILSGPEPQRTFLEEALLKQLSAMKDKRILFVRGRPDLAGQPQPEAPFEVLAFMKGAELNEAIEASGVVITRSGYSTLMDLAGLGKQALLIPTPGQTEQIYLAEEAEKQGIYAMQHQENLDIEAGLEAARRAGGIKIKQDSKLLETAVAAFLAKSSQNNH